MHGRVVMRLADKAGVSDATDLSRILALVNVAISGHATFGGAVFQMLRHLAGTDNVAFTFVSDELNGETVDSHGVLRPLLPRTFSTFSQAEEENGQSRIDLGIHWSFDKTAGIDQGRHIADAVFSRAARPR